MQPAQCNAQQVADTQHTGITGTAIIYLTFLDSSLELQAFLGKDQICVTKQHNPVPETHQFLNSGVELEGQEAKQLAICGQHSEPTSCFQLMWKDMEGMELGKNAFHLGKSDWATGWNPKQHLILRTVPETEWSASSWQARLPSSHSNQRTPERRTLQCHLAHMPVRVT